MTISLSHELWLMVYSFFFGIFLGVVYDAVCLVRIVCGVGRSSAVSQRLYSMRLPIIREKRAYLRLARGRGASFLLMLFGDIVYSLLSAAMYAVFITHTNQGRVRWYYLLMSGAGFLVYHLTVSRLVISVFEVSFWAVRAALRYLCEILVLPVRVAAKAAKKFAAFLCRRLFRPFFSALHRRVAYAYTERVRRSLERSIKFTEISEVTSDDPKTARDN